MGERNGDLKRGVFSGNTFLPVLVLAVFVACSNHSDVPAFDGDSAYRFLKEQCDIGPRFPGSTGHKRVQRYIVGRLREYGANISIQPFDAVLSTGDTLHLINIIANYNRKCRKRILLGAHYDTRPRADRDETPENRDKPILGANDGASGIAVLLELARIFKEQEPPVGVDLLFIDGEDYGLEGNTEDYLLGSKHFVIHRKGYTPSAVIILDMIGDADLKIKVEGFSRAASGRLVDEIFDIADSLGIDSFSRERGLSIIDDHLPFIQAGINAVDLIDFDYPYWHTLEDTPDKCSPSSLEAVGTVVLHYVWSRG